MGSNTTKKLPFELESNDNTKQIKKDIPKTLRVLPKKKPSFGAAVGEELMVGLGGLLGKSLGTAVGELVGGVLGEPLEAEPGWTLDGYSTRVGALTDGC